MTAVRQYEVLFIDLDDTLYDFSTNSREAYRAVYELLQYDQWFESFEHYYEIYWEYNQQLWTRYSAGEITRDYLNAERYAHPLRVMGVTEAEAISTRFWDEAMKRLPLGTRLMPHAREILEYLSPKYRLYILSNGFTELQAHKMSSAGIAHYFDGVILSEDIGVNKPHPAIFEHALRVAGVAAHQALMIGDNLEADIQGAHQVGMEQVFYNSKRIAAPDSSLPYPTHTIHSLLELKEIL
ncbi:MAG: YjjG family noncanonical pyrimidine nucleotidase [Bacteroidaceae bacterium]|nr:YjjG family noncanonical pyrimidine nucleotidase [Bacteroidaceae bacterium]